MERRNVKWHKMTAENVVSQLHTNAACGLTRKAARSRYRKFGANTLFGTQKNNRGAFWLSVLRDPSILLLAFILFFACCFSVQAPVLAAVAVTLVVVALTFFLMRKSNAADEIISLYSIPTVFVLREGKVLELSAQYLVPGDILLLQKGDIVPCDCRILEENGDFCTRLIYRDAKGRRTAVEQIKKTDTVYPYESTVFAPSCENILYGKSEVLEGFARAVAVETGSYTYMGATRQNRSEKPESTAEGLHRSDHMAIDPFARIYSLILIFLLLPLTVIGFFTAPEGYGILRVFLPLCTLCAIGSYGIVRLFFHSALGDGYLQCAFPEGEVKHRAVPKSLAALQKACDITDLVVIGTCASSDGLMHLHRAALGCGEVSLLANKQPMLSALCEAYAILSSAKSNALNGEKSQRMITEPDSRRLYEELQNYTDYDLAALQIRLKGATVFYGADKILLDVKMKSGDARFCFTDKISSVHACTHYEINGKMMPLEKTQKEALMQFVSSAKKENAEVVVVLKQAGGKTALLGVLACREQMQSSLQLTLEELSDYNVRTSFFLENDSERALLYVNAAKLPHSVLRASDVKGDDDFAKLFEKYRVFVGFSKKQIQVFLKILRQENSKIAILGSGWEVGAFQSDAMLCMACDPLTHRSNQKEQVLLNENEIFSFSNHYSRALSAKADILLPSADRDGGGLLSFLHLLSVARNVQHRMTVLLRYLIGVQWMRLFMILFSIVSGVGLLSGAQMVFGGMVFDLIAVFWILSASVPQKILQKTVRFDQMQIKKTIGDKKMTLSPIIAMAVVCLYVLILSLAGLMNPISAGVHIFYALLFLQITVLYQTVLTSGVHWEWKNDLLPLLLIFVPVFILQVLSLLLPHLAMATELPGFSWIGACSLPLGIASYLWGYRLLSRLIRFIKNIRKYNEA